MITTSSIATQNLRVNEAIEYFANTYARKKEQSKETSNIPVPPGLNVEKLKQGIIEYESLVGYQEPGIEVVEEQDTDPQTLKYKKYARKGATTVAVISSVIASVGLIYSGLKLVFSSLFNIGDIDNAYNTTSKSYIAGSIAGATTGGSLESINWSIGSAGMGFLSRYINQPWGLSVFSIFDGINAIGMGEVNRRDNRNSAPYNSTIFDNPLLSSFKFLIPYEQAVKNFFKRLTSLQGIKKILYDEPYSIYQTAGGGLITGGTALLGASIFSSQMSEKIKSLFNIPYALCSLVNVIALGRDGLVKKKRSETMDGREPKETKVMNLEGWFKAVASPFLALNYGLLALKPFGLDIGGAVDHVAMAFRSWGVAIAQGAFAFQSGIKFVLPEMFGPEKEQKFKIITRPKIIMEYFMNMIKGTNEYRNRPQHLEHENNSGFFESIINEDSCGELLNRVAKTQRMQSLKYRSLTGPPHPAFIERSVLNRFIHTRRVGAIGVNSFNIALNNAIEQYGSDHYLVNFLRENEDAFKLACETHDNGHADLPRCHLAEYALDYLNNDEQSIAGLNPGTEIYNTVVQYYKELHGEEEGTKTGDKVCKTAQLIISFKHPLSWLYKPCDYLEYVRANGSDFNTSFELPAWGKEDYEYFASQTRIYLDKKGKVKIDFTREGGILAFKMLYYRALFNAYVNYHPITLAREQAYKDGIVRSNLARTDLFTMTEDGFDEAANNGVQKIKNSFASVTRNIFGSRTQAYCGWLPKDRIKVEGLDFLLGENGEIGEGYLDAVIQYDDPELYEILKPMAKVLLSRTLNENILETLPTSLDDQNYVSVLRSFGNYSELPHWVLAA